MSATRKPTTGSARSKATTARPKAAKPSTSGAAKGRTTRTPPVRSAPPAPSPRRVDNLPLWIILGFLAVVDVVFGILAIAR